LIEIWERSDYHLATPTRLANLAVKKLSTVNLNSICTATF
jgi:hypothetical protein